MIDRTLPPPRSAPDPLDDEVVRWLAGPLAAALPADVAPAHAHATRERLLDRVTRSARAARAFFTVRLRDAPATPGPQGVTTRLLYAAAGDPQRAGEPRRVRLIALDPGAAWTPETPAAGDHCEWLVLQGKVELDDEVLKRCDYHRVPAGTAPARLRSVDGGLLYLRESPQPGTASPQAHTVHDAGGAWDEFAPGIWRRVLWSEGGEAAMLYHTLPGAQVPGHGHGRDEECLMLDGEVFLDDVLLRRFDYQLAPAGTAHQGVGTDTGVVLFAHGDLDLDLHP